MRELGRVRTHTGTETNAGLLPWQLPLVVRVMIHAEARVQTASPASDPDVLATDNDEVPPAVDAAGTGLSRRRSDRTPGR